MSKMTGRHVAAVVAAWIAQATVMSFWISLTITSLADISISISRYIQMFWKSFMFSVIVFLPQVVFLFLPAIYLMLKSGRSKIHHFLLTGVGVGIIGIPFTIIWSAPFASSAFRIDIGEIGRAIIYSFGTIRTDVLFVVGGATAGVVYWIVTGCRASKGGE